MDIDKNFQNIADGIRRIKLSSEEKADMRAELELFIQAHPVRKAESQCLPLRERSKSYISYLVGMAKLKTFINKLQNMNKLQKLATALVIVLTMGVGTSFAAERALPGDILYPVKVGFNEKIRGALAVSNQAQAEWNTRRAERRLEEAEQLALKDKLSSQVASDIGSRFEASSADFEKSIEKIGADENTETSLELHSNFEALLRAHGEILDRIASKTSSNDGEVELLLNKVTGRLKITEKDRKDEEEEVSGQTDSQFKAAAAGKLKAAENKADEVRDFLGEEKASISAEAQVKAESDLEAVDNAIAQGKAEMETEAYGKAFASFQNALRLAQEAKLRIVSDQKIKLEIRLPDINSGDKIKTGSGDENGSLDENEDRRDEENRKDEDRNKPIKIESDGRLKIEIK